MALKLRPTGFQFRYLPCLRCGRLGVVAIVPKRFKELDCGDLMCKWCCVPHYLMARNEHGMWWAVYDRDTRRYPADHYDERPVVGIQFGDVPLDHSEDDDRPFPCHGPIMVFKRFRFSPAHIAQIWQQSGGKCHLCKKKKWRLNQHGRTGWHVDHVIPNIGGGRDTEMLSNFRVACARCNLRKGRGHTTRTIRDDLRRLFVSPPLPSRKSSSRRT